MLYLTVPTFFYFYLMNGILSNTHYERHSPRSHISLSAMAEREPPSIAEYLWTYVPAVSRPHTLQVFLQGQCHG